MSLVARLRDRNPLPPGAFVVGLGLGLSGLATYVFFAITSRVLDPASYAAVGVLWSLLFAVGNGGMQPLEQEVARAVADRRARGIGAGPVIRKAVGIGAVGFQPGALAVKVGKALFGRFELAGQRRHAVAVGAGIIAAVGQFIAGIGQLLGGLGLFGLRLRHRGLRRCDRFFRCTCRSACSLGGSCGFAPAGECVGVFGKVDADLLEDRLGVPLDDLDRLGAQHLEVGDVARDEARGLEADGGAFRPPCRPAAAARLASAQIVHRPPP
jgi:hypothetical protein